ncbi:MAG: hypothetical protein IPM24_00935 [Bryobacterales bacterium]|nr:hypothetical protein [Bryobacterales bacterium]
MTVYLELRPEIEANLAAQAEARGLSLDSYLRQVLEDLAQAAPSAAVSLEDLRAALDALAAMGNDLPHLPSSAFSRETIYQDHD